MHLRVAVILFAIGGIASAEPRHSCRELPASTFAKLPKPVQDKLGAGERFESRRDWKKLLVMVNIARAPHIAREILLDCPGVVSIDDATPLDARRFQSQVRMRVTSFAALARIGQLPAVAYVSVFDPDVRIKHPMPDIDFE